MGRQEEFEYVSLDVESEPSNEIELHFTENVAESWAEDTKDMTQNPEHTTLAETSCPHVQEPPPRPPRKGSRPIICKHGAKCLFKEKCRNYHFIHDVIVWSQPMFRERSNIPRCKNGPICPSQYRCELKHIIRDTIGWLPGPMSTAQSTYILKLA